MVIDFSMTGGFDMLDDLKKEVCEANLKLVEYELVILTWGNASAITPDRKHIVIKPSGVEYESMTPDDMVVVDINGKVVDGRLKPSSDTPSHLEIYRNFPNIGAIIHTHSTYATIFAQRKMPLPCLGTTHADYFYGDVPVSRQLRDDEIRTGYELNTGKVVCETIKEGIPAVLVASHAPFVFGKTLAEVVENAVVLENVAKMAVHCPGVSSIPKALLDKHYLRKHGPDSYYGQGRKH